MKAAFSPGTFKNLKIQLNTYLLFCEQFNRLAVPIDQETLWGYACILAEHFKSSDSVRNYLTVLLKFDVEVFYWPTLKMTSTGVEKLNTYIPKIRIPLEPAHLYSIYKVLDLSSITNTVFWALRLIGFYGMLRKSPLDNNSRNTFNPKEQLTRGDVEFTHEGLSINIQWSKTWQKHNKIHQIPLKRIKIVFYAQY